MCSCNQATNVESTIAGVGGLQDKAVVLLGGAPKRNADGSLGFERLVPYLRGHHSVVTFGKNYHGRYTFATPDSRNRLLTREMDALSLRSRDIMK